MWYYIYYFTMIKSPSGKRLLVFKATCVALALMLGGILFTTGVVADPGCGVKCCCQSNLINQHHNSVEQIRSSMGCCSEDPVIPCDLQSGPTNGLPVITLASNCCDLANSVGLPGILTDSLNDRHDFRVGCSFQFVQEKSKSPPIYLQNLTFLI